MRKRRLDWITQELVGQVTKKKRLWIVCMRQRDMVSARTYKKTGDKGDKKMVRNAKRRIQRKLTKDKNDKNGGNFTRFIKSKTRSITGIGPLKKSVGVLCHRKKRNGRFFQQCIHDIYHSIQTPVD